MSPSPTPVPLRPPSLAHYLPPKASSCQRAFRSLPVRPNSVRALSLDASLDAFPQSQGLALLPCPPRPLSDHAAASCARAPPTPLPWHVVHHENHAWWTVVPCLSHADSGHSQPKASTLCGAAGPLPLV